MTPHRGAPSELDIVVSNEQPVREDVVERQNGRFTPLTRFDEAFLLLRHWKGLKVPPELLVKLLDPRPVSASLDDEQLHEDGSASVEGVCCGGSDVALAFEVRRKFHRFAPVLLADIEALALDSGKASA